MHVIAGHSLWEKAAEHLRAHQTLSLPTLALIRTCRALRALGPAGRGCRRASGALYLLSGTLGRVEAAGREATAADGGQTWPVAP